MEVLMKTPIELFEIAQKTGGELWIKLFDEKEALDVMDYSMALSIMISEFCLFLKHEKVIQDPVIKAHSIFHNARILIEKDER
jgi:hypothetical protein